ncbi:MAG: hypothetical protein Q8L48_16815 [Archangium sp.]|nr:hypothetical protein [Archangium sp.]
MSAPLSTRPPRPDVRWLTRNFQLLNGCWLTPGWVDLTAHPEVHADAIDNMRHPLQYWLERLQREASAHVVELKPQDIEAIVVAIRERCRL